MCGIAGFWSPTQFAAGAKALPTALAAIRHRGPDASSKWLDETVGVALGHVRLSILDLSDAGAQPMASATGRYVIVFNGEIYNHFDMRSELDSEFSRSWRGHSDTETLLAGIETWGLDATLKRCVGMFALVLWDAQDQTLVLARDRLGEKPLYYSWQNGTFAFASELKALMHLPLPEPTVDRQALCMLLKHGYIPAPYTIYVGVSKLQPGQMLSLRWESGAISAPAHKAYWSFAEVRAGALFNPFLGSDAEAIDLLETSLKTAVQGQMLSDVPLGAFLSGGVDSSIIVALMQSVSEKPVKTFSIGFNESGYSELEHACAVANHLKTDHTELVVTPADALAVIPRLPEIYDEPFADVSQIPTYVVSQLAKTQVTVSLSGDGGDELFTGYNRYVWGERVWRTVASLPLGLRRVISRGVRKVAPAQWDWLLSRVSWLLPRRWRFKTVGNKLHRLAAALGAGSGKEFYEALSAKWIDPAAVVLGVDAASCSVSQLPGNGKLSIEDMMAMDTLSYLPDDILVKVDRAAMACSLETRVPLLDHRVVELAWRMPLRLKVRDGDGKWVLRRLLDRYVPRALMDRPKMGFDVPLDSWLRGPLKEWAEKLLSADRLQREGYFDVRQIRTKWEDHLSGRCNWQGQLWCVLMFQAWLEKNNI